jgi:hypothetical protein
MDSGKAIVKINEILKTIQADAIASPPAY